MYVVGIVELGTALDAEAQALAARLGKTAYETRLKLLGGFPASVLSTVDRELAFQTLSELESRGHEAVVLDSATLVANERMPAIRRFRFEPDAIVLDDPNASRLPASDVAALLRAVHHTRTDLRAEVQTKSFSVGRALMTGGLMSSKTTKSEERSSSTDTEPVLYAFRRSGDTPWILRERGTNYSALGPELGPSSMQNFLTTVRRLRELAPHAVYDERLLELRVQAGPPFKTTRLDAESLTASTASSVDIAAHLLARWISER
jgi:hypothetical protein